MAKSHYLIILLYSLVNVEILVADMEGTPKDVEIEQGKLSGKTVPDYKGRPYHSFQGIPYAKPPVDQLRFKAPLPPEPWTGVLDATKEGADCYQMDPINNRFGGSDDCLFVNVYTPAVDPAEPMPVLFWIYGGGFMGGSSSTDLYGPEYLMPQNIVLVTINYRVGISGFLSLEDESLGVTGNAGLKDMVMALKWVQKNIAKFGGDPDNVTIAGGSAGGASVHLLVLSKMAKGLFHKAIAQSGSALHPWALSRSVTDELCDKLRIARGSEQVLLDRLRAMSLKHLHDLQSSIPDASEVSAKRSFGPTIEKPGPEAFLTREPIEIIHSEDYNHVPLIMGFNSLEGAFMDILLQSKLQPPSDFREVVPNTLNLSPNTSPSAQQVADQIEQHYQQYQRELYPYYLYTDNTFARDVVFAAEFHAKTSSAPVYLYEMFIETKLNHYKQMSKVTHPGTCHGDEIFYLFKTKVTDVRPGSPEEKAVQQVTTLWADFVRHGDPNGGKTGGSRHWKPIKWTEVNYLRVDPGERSEGIELTSAVEPEKERMAFWHEIFKIRSLYAELIEEGVQFKPKD